MKGIRARGGRVSVPLSQKHTRTIPADDSQIWLYMVQCLQQINAQVVTPTGVLRYGRRQCEADLGLACHRSSPTLSQH